MSIGPYTTSNENIAYPFLPGDGIAYKDQGIAAIVSAAKMASWFLVDAAVEIAGSVDTVHVVSIAHNVSDIFVATLMTNTGDTYTCILPYSDVSPYVAWQHSLLYKASVATVNSLWVLPGSGYRDYLGAIPTLGSVTFSGTSVCLDPSVVSNPTPAVLSVAANSVTLIPAGGIVKVMAGYNIGLDLQPLAGLSATGDGVISAFESPTSAIMISAVSGAGAGTVPCTEPISDTGVLRRLGGATADKNGNVSLDTDGCYRAEPSLRDPHTIILSGDCEACCSCDNYESVLERLRTQFQYSGQLVAAGFGGEFDTTAVTLFARVSVVGSPEILYMRAGSSSYTLRYNLHMLGSHSYGRWEYFKDSSLVFFSTATTSIEAPLGVLWYEGSMPEDIYYDATTSDHDPLAATCRPLRTSLVYPVGTVASPAIMSFYISRGLPLGLDAAYQASLALHNGNMESYSRAVELWNIMGYVSSSQVAAWLTAGSNPVKMSGLYGHAHAILTIRVLSLGIDSNPAWLWSSEAYGDVSYGYMRHTYYCNNINANFVTGPVSKSSPFSRVSIVERQGAQPSSLWSMEYGMAAYQISDDGHMAGSSLSVSYAGQTYAMLPVSGTLGDAPAMLFTTTGSGDVDTIPSLALVPSTATPSSYHWVFTDLNGIKLYSPALASPYQRTIPDGGILYSMLPAPWCIAGVDIRPANTYFVHAEVGT